MNIGLALLAAGVLALPLAVGPVLPAAAQVATCGEVIDDKAVGRDRVYVLENDVGPCEQGLIVIASNVTVDLNGHNVSGVFAGNSVGILVRARRGVTVTNGRVFNFRIGVMMSRMKSTPTTLSRLSDMVLAGNTLGVALNATDSLVTGITTFANNVGVIVSGPGNTLVANDISGNSFDGLVVAAPDTTVQANTLSSNGNDGVSAGVTVRPEGAGSLVVGNHIESTDVGIEVFGDGTTVRDNTVTRLGLSGVVIGSSSNSVVGNTVTYSGLAPGATGDGIFVSGGTQGTPVTGNLVESNTVASNATNGIRVDCTRSAVGGPCAVVGQGNQILGNVVSANGGENAGSQVIDSAGVVVGSYDLLDANPDGGCESNIWSGNTGWSTAFPACTTAG